MKVLIYDWEIDASKEFGIKAIRIASKLNIAGARRVVESCMDGQPALVECLDNQSALDLVEQLDEVGFLAKRVPE